MSKTHGHGQREQNQIARGLEKQEQARNTDRMSKRGETGSKQQAGSVDDNSRDDGPVEEDSNQYVTRR